MATANGQNALYENIRGLLVEDNPADARFVEEMLRDITEAPVSLTHVESLSAAVRHLSSNREDIILLDMTLPDSEWPHTLLYVAKCAPDAAIIILTGLDDETRAIQSLKRGAQDYLVKGDINSRLLSRTMLHAVERQRLRLKMLLFEEALQSKQKLIEAMNRTLEQRVREEVDRNREKDYMMLQQGRLAAMGEMIGNIAHQWRQPLNALGLLIQDLGHAYRYGELNGEYLEKSIKEGMEKINFMSQTIDDFRNFFKPDKEKKFFRTKEVLDTALSFVGDSFRNNGIEIKLFPDAETDVVGYPNEYSHAILNILSNAKDILLERGTKDPSVTIRLFLDNGRSVTSVTDNAGGIDEAIIDKIFDPYYTTKKPGEGTGLGLYMSKMIIEKNMGGKLTVRNTSGGAEFRIEV